MYLCVCTTHTQRQKYPEVYRTGIIMAFPLLSHLLSKHLPTGQASIPRAHSMVFRTLGLMETAGLQFGTETWSWISGVGSILPHLLHGDTHTHTHFSGQATSLHLMHAVTTWLGKYIHGSQCSLQGPDILTLNLLVLVSGRPFTPLDLWEVHPCGFTPMDQLVNSSC